MKLTRKNLAQPTQGAIALAGYQITEQLYTGSRTLVYQAIRTADQQPVVIKLLKNEHPSFSEIVQFRNQYAIIANLNIPGIIQPYSLEPYSNGYALVMEDFGGISLRHFANGRSLALEQFWAIALQLIDILHPLHQQCVIHKDIKPANILIHPETFQVKLIDFSISSLLPREAQEIKTLNRLEGTLAYLSPEQTGRMNRGTDYRSDFYSLGVTFYELLAGQLPFQSSDPMEIVHCHIAELPLPVCDLNPDIPLMLGEIVHKLMAKNAEDRYQSALGLKYDLQNCLTQLRETGKVEPFEIGRRDVCDRFLISEKLYGREAEVQTLLKAFDRVANGTSELILVAGFSGIGKTAVVNEVHKPIVRQRGYFIKGKFDQFNRNIPFSAFVESFRDLIGQLLSESDAQLHNWKTQILSALGNNGQAIIDVIPELEQIIGAQPAVSELSGTAAQNRFNLLFQRFIQVFTTPEHPLVIFLDDLQWSDLASLNLMQVLMNESKSGYLLLIGAYRDNEVFPDHLLMLTLDDIRKARTTVNTVTLQPLSQSSLNQLVSDTLNCGLEVAAPLTDLVSQKTKGNPFFGTQFLKALYQDGLIGFDLQAGHWQCDIVGVREAALTDDVVELMAAQLKKLPEATQTILKLAACVGNQFDLNTLAIASEQSETEVTAALWKALQEGLVLPQSEVYKFYSGHTQLDLNSELNPQPSEFCYKFLHDRVQQAAYGLIPESQRQALHLKIGRLLQQQTADTEWGSRSFAMINYLNMGSALVIEQAEREALAHLNLRACHHAKLATAYGSAVQYATMGISLLPIESWNLAYDLTLALYNAAAEAAYLTTAFEEADTLIQAIWQGMVSPLDCVKSYELAVQVSIAKDQQVEAIETGLEALAKLGVSLVEWEPSRSLPPLPTPDELAQKSTMTNPGYLAALRLLIAIMPPIHHVKPDLFPAATLTLLDLCDRGGYSGLAAFTYGTYGLFLGALMGDPETAHRSGQLSLAILERYPAPELRAKVNMLFAVFVCAFKEPASQTLALLKQGIEVGLETGDIEHASYCVMAYFTHLLLTGQPLETVEQQQKTYLELLHKYKQEHCIEYTNVWLRLAQRLSQQWMLTDLDDTLAESQAEQLQHFEATHNHQCLFALHLAALIATYTFGDQAAAVAHAQAAAKSEKAAFGILLESAHNCYYSLALLGQWGSGDEGGDRDAALQQVGVNQIKLKNWATHAPMNYQHKVDLVEAERCRVLGNKAEAIALYDRAIEGAKANNYVQDEALANELAANFYLEWHKERIAQEYLIEAYYNYARWGAKAKIADLETRYPQLLAPILQQNRSSITVNETIFARSIVTSTTESSSSILDSLDLAAILKASQTISGEIELEKLLSSLLSIIIENAGADKCVLMLLRDSRLLIKGLVTKKTQPVVLQSLPVEDSQEIPLKLIYKVQHDKHTVVLLDGTDDITLANDPYIIRQQPKSILCSPILHQGKLMGILYLENSLATGAFTSDRVELLNLLCAQVAISLENARLYQRSQTYAQQLEASLEDLKIHKAQFQRLVANVPGMIYQFRLEPDGSHSTPYVSSGCYDLYEIEPAAVMAGEQSLYAMQHPDDIAAIERAISHSAQTLNPFEQEFRIMTRSGKVKWVQSIARPERQPDKAIVWDGVVIDISDRKQAETEREASEAVQARLIAILEATTDIVGMADATGKSIYLNKAGQQALGIPAEQMNQFHIAEVTAPAMWEVMQTVILPTVIQTGRWSGESRLLTRNNEEIPISQVLVAHKNQQGEVEFFSTIIRDIRDRKQAEATLQISEQNLRTIFNNVNSAIFLHDKEGNVLDMNDRALELYDIQPTQVQTISVVNDCSAPDNPFHLVPGFWAEALAGKTVHFEWKASTPAHDRIFDVDITLTKIELDGEAVILANVLDISERQAALRERKRAEDQLNQRTVELEQTLQELQRTQTQMVQAEKMSGLGQLVAGVAHEINNPVNFIYGNLNHADSYTQDLLGLIQLYQQHYPTPHPAIQQEADAIDLDFLTDDLPKLLQSMKVGADRIQSIVASLRNFSRMDEAEMKEVNIHDGIDSTLMILQHRLKAKADHPSIEIIKNYDELPPVECYAGQLNQVFMNLLSNAIDALEEAFNSRASTIPTITIQTNVVNAQRVAIHITDNGSGIPDSVQQRLFDPFFTTKPVGKGTGMGLSISYQIVTEKHKGTLQCVSQPGQGATFSIQIPIRQF